MCSLRFGVLLCVVDLVSICCFVTVVFDGVNSVVLFISLLI